MKKPSYAYVTFVMKNDIFVMGALVLGYSLLKQCTNADLVCLVTDDVSLEARKALGEIYTKVIVVDEIRTEHPNAKGRSDRTCIFTRFQTMRLGKNGDLGCDYDKIVVLDADIMSLKNYDALFDVPAPAGIINEKKSHWLGNYCSEEGKTVWHQIYETTCGHGQLIPKSVTDQVKDDSTNLGVNGCLWILEPDYEEYMRIMDCLEDQSVKDRIGRFNWPEMQFATWYWSGKWHNVDIRYAAYNGQPHISLVYGTHFAGFKPWDDKDRKVLKRYMRYHDFRLWYEMLNEMCSYVYPEMINISRIRRLLKFYRRFNGIHSNERETHRRSREAGGLSV